MDPLWSPAVATASKRSRREGLESPLETARSFATGCQRLPPRRRGNEGVDGSSPSEASSEVPANVGIASPELTCRFARGNVKGTFDPLCVTKGLSSASRRDPRRRRIALAATREARSRTGRAWSARVADRAQHERLSVRLRQTRARMPSGAARADVATKSQTTRARRRARASASRCALAAPASHRRRARGRSAALIRATLERRRRKSTP
jgi:hypothetical protein